MSRIKPWSELENSYVSFDVNSTTAESKADTDNPSRIHLTNDGRIVMNGTTLGDRNPQRGHWDGRVVINRAVPCNAKAGMAYYFSDGIIKFKFNKTDLSKLKTENYTPTEFVGATIYERGYVTWKTISATITAADEGQGLYNALSKSERGCVLFSDTSNHYECPVIVVILKEGPLDIKGKYKVIRLSQFVPNNGGSWAMQTRSPYHEIHDGCIVYTKPFYWKRSALNGHSDELNIIENDCNERLRITRLRKAKKRKYEEYKSAYCTDNSKCRYILRKLNNKDQDVRHISVLQPILYDRKGRRSQGYAPKVICTYWNDGSKIVVYPKRILTSTNPTNVLH
jgi:hypothetical protein